MPMFCYFYVMLYNLIMRFKEKSNIMIAKYHKKLPALYQLAEVSKKTMLRKKAKTNKTTKQRTHFWKTVFGLGIYSI